MSRSISQLRTEHPAPLVGVLVLVLTVAFVTAIIYPLARIAPVRSLSVLYVLAVLLVSTYWGFGYGILTALVSGATFDFFHLPPVGSFGLTYANDWVALSAFLLTAAAVAFVSELARKRAVEAEQRRREADLTAVMAQQLLGADRLEDALAATAHRLAAAVGATSAAIELASLPADPRRLVFPLEAAGARIGTLALPVTLAPAARKRVAVRVVPALQSILAAALHRAELQSEVVETAAVRRSDEMKTAVLRSVSHDLRTPVTAVLTAAGALDPSHPESVTEIRELLLESGTRLWRLIEKLLDLSLLEAGTAEPRLDWFAIEEVIEEAIAHVDAGDEMFRVLAGEELPLLRGDPGQLERAFANLFENAARHSAGKPVSVLVRVVGDRMRVRIVDQGPGIAPGEQERIFLPFYRSREAAASFQGSGLGLAIAKGFVEVNGGRIGVDSLPGQGSSFVVEFPLAPMPPPLVAS